MKKLKTVSVALALFATMSAFATKGKKVTKENNLTGQIYELLKEHEFKLDSEELTAEVRFIVNEEGELVVLSVETDHDIVEGYVKNRLNYKKVQSEEIVPGRVYELPVRITA
jgi:hypothetical protein